VKKVEKKKKAKQKGSENDLHIARPDAVKK